MDKDFYIELMAPAGLQPLEPLLRDMPFDIHLETRGDGVRVLVQGAVSEFAGFYVGARTSGDRHFYCAAVKTSAPGEPEDILRSMSTVFTRAGMPHWIWRIEHELDEDDLIVDCGRGHLPSSERGDR
jgi:hypothetical protein